MAYYTRTFTTECLGDLFTAITENAGISSNLIQLINAEGPDVIFEFDGNLSPTEESELDSMLASWICPPTPTVSLLEDAVIDDNTTAPDGIWSSSKIAEYVDSEISNVATGIVSLVGKTFDVGFAANSNKASRMWLSQQTADTGQSSNKVPFVIPWDSRLISITFINASDDKSTSVELWKTEYSYEPKANKELVYTLNISNARSAVEQNFGPADVLFSAGDYAAVYIDGDRLDHPLVQLTFMVISGTTNNKSDSFTDDFA